LSSASKEKRWKDFKNEYFSWKRKTTIIYN
jgi:hypothetical protein